MLNDITIEVKSKKIDFRIKLPEIKDPDEEEINVILDFNKAKIFTN